MSGVTPSTPSTTIQPVPSLQQQQQQQRTNSTLPAECLVMIFGYLDEDRSTLHSLLRVNHHFFHLVVPILYRSPFRLLESRAEAWSWSERTQRQVHLLQLFMHVVQIKQTDRRQQHEAQRTGRKWRHTQTPRPSSYSSTATTTVVAISASSSAPTSGSNLDSFIVGRKQQQQQQPHLFRRQRKILRFKSGTQPWWSRKRPSFSTPSSPSTSSPTSSSSPSSFSSSFSSNWTSSSSPSSSYSTSPSSFVFLGSKKESNLLDPENIQEACLQLEQSPLSFTTTDHFLHDHPTLTTTTPAVADNINNNNNNPACLNYPIARSSNSRSNNTNNTTNNSSNIIDNCVIDCGQHCSHRRGEPSQQTDLCFRCYFDPEDPIDCNNITFGDSCRSSGDPFTDTDHHQLYSHTYMDTEDEDSVGGSDNDDDNDDCGINSTLADTTFSPWGSLEPDLGPFNTQPDQARSNNWTRALQQRLRCITGMGSRNTATEQQQQQHHSEGLMADYLQHYVDQSHPGLVRILPYVFPTLPAEAFDQLSYSRAMIATTSSLPGYGGSLSPSTSHSVLNIFNNLQPSHGSNLERAQSIRVGVERDLLHHSPHRITTIAVSVSRLPAVMSLPRRQSSPPQRRGSSSQSTTAATARGGGGGGEGGGLHSTAVSSLTSLFSFLSSSPFSASPLSNLPTATSSSSSLSSLHSTQSSCSTVSSSPPSDAWATLHQFSRLRHLIRIELHDIHHRFDEEAVVDFLTSHSKTYDTIREVKIGGPNDIGKSTAPGVVRILSSLRKVRVLDMTEWREAIKYLDMMPTQHLETLLLGNVRMTKNNHPDTLGVEEQQQLLQQQQQQQQQQQEQQQQSNDMDEDKEDPQIWALQQCRRLRELRMPVLVDGLFEWAVHERQVRLGSFSRPSLSWSPSSALPNWVDGPSPVQLEIIHLSGSSTGPLISTLLHVVDAFRDSLQVLQSTSWIDMTETGSCGQSLTWTWCLPNLQVLDLQGEVAYRFKVQSLESCPQLRVLRLTLPPSSPASIGASAVGSSANSSDLMATTTTSAMAEPEVSGRPLLSSVPSSPSAWSSRVCACTRRDQRRRQRQRQQQQQQLSLADVLGDDDVYDNDDSEDSDCVCVNWNSNNSNISSTSASYIGRDLPHHHHHHRRYDLFGRLEELKLVGDWGLTDSSLLGIAKKMPRLERLSLLRCESDKLTAQGLIRAIPSLRGVGGSVKKGEEGSKNNCRVRWMEICKSWQCEIESAIGSEDEYESSSSGSSQSNMAFVAAVKGGVCPLHIKYQY